MTAFNGGAEPRCLDDADAVPIAFPTPILVAVVVAAALLTLGGPVFLTACFVDAVIDVMMDGKKGLEVKCGSVLTTQRRC